MEQRKLYAAIRNDEDSSNRDSQSPRNELTAEADAPAVPEDTSEVAGRLDKLERQNRRIRLALMVVSVLLGLTVFLQLSARQTTVDQTLAAPKELRLVDGSGATRALLRMYSEKPVLQLIDSKGTPRLALGMRLDDAPFISLADQKGQTRATVELTGGGSPSIKLFDGKGQPSFTIN
jgi:hypothetical protein